MRNKIKISLIIVLCTPILVFSHNSQTNSFKNFTKNFNGFSTDSLFRIKIYPIKMKLRTNIVYRYDVVFQIVKFPELLINYSNILFQIRFYNTRNNYEIRSSLIEDYALTSEQRSLYSNITLKIPAGEIYQPNQGGKIEGELQYYLEATEFYNITSSNNIQISWREGLISKVTINQPLPFKSFIDTHLFLFIIISIIAFIFTVKKESHLGSAFSFIVKNVKLNLKLIFVTFLLILVFFSL